jgi:3-deoxy-D-manno-octulosonic-acid transferase
MFLYILYFSLFYQIINFIGITAGDFLKYKIHWITYLKRFYQNAQKHSILFYGASNGETLSLIPISSKLLGRGVNFCYCCGSPTSYQIMQKKEKHVYLKPFDNIISTGIFLLLIMPRVIVMAEADIWPFFVFISKILKIKLILVNYQIKTKKYWIQNKIRSIIHYNLSDHIYTKIDYPKHKNMNYIGNLKILAEKIDKNIIKNNNYTVIISSAHQNEMFIHLPIIEYCLSHGIQIIYVPRYLNWEKELKSKTKHFSPYWIYNHDKLIKELVNKENFIIVHCFGLLKQMYQYSHLCIMGATFNKVGGHNIMEPVANQNVLILGPNYQTCQDLYQLLNINDNIQICQNKKEIIQHIKKNKENLQTSTYWNNICDQIKEIQKDLNNRLLLFINKHLI